MNLCNVTAIALALELMALAGACLVGVLLLAICHEVFEAIARRKEKHLWAAVRHRRDIAYMLALLESQRIALRPAVLRRTARQELSLHSRKCP